MSVLVRKTNLGAIHLPTLLLHSAGAPGSERVLLDQGAKHTHEGPVLLVSLLNGLKISRGDEGMYPTQREKDSTRDKQAEI